MASTVRTPPSLLDFPPPLQSSSYSLNTSQQLETLPTDAFGDFLSQSICEYESILQPVTRVSTPRPAQILTAIAAKTVTVKPKSHLSETSQVSGELSAKNAFLPASKVRAAVVDSCSWHTAVRRILATWYEEGLNSALEQLSSQSSGDTKPNFLRKVVSLVAKSILAVYRSTVNIHSSLNPHLMLSGDDMIAQFCQVREWHSSQVRGLSWHPHSLKIAVAFRDDTLEVHGVNMSVSPLLKYKYQKCISCLSWRPLNASDLAIGCLNGIVIWSLDPTSVAVRPSASNVTFLQAPGHTPITSLAWDPRGKLLLSSSAADTSMILWNPASETQTPLRRVGGGGVHLVTWSPGHGRSILAAAPSTVFRIWETRTWTNERWNVRQGYIRSACWSPCGSHLLFATSCDPVIYSLNVSSQPTSSAIPVVDLTVVGFDDNDAKAGGIIQQLVWDPLGERLAVSFQDSNLVAIFSTSTYPSLSFSPLGFVSGQCEEYPSTMDFAGKFEEGALLSIAWSTGRLQHVPLFFVPNVQARLSRPANVILDPDFEVPVGERPDVFSQPSPILFSPR